MKKFAPLTIALLLIISINVLSQSDESSNQKTQVGLGLDLELANLNSSQRFPPTSIIFSIKPTNSIRIEPGFGFYTEKSSTDTDGEEDDYSRLRLGLGGYWVISTKNVSPYIGLYTDYTNLNYDYDSGTAIQSGHTFRIGPAVGLQYQIVENFSIGGEFLILNQSEKYDTERPETGETYEHNASVWSTVSRLSFRFYF
jgi:hypothetical protein